MQAQDLGLEQGCTRAGNIVGMVSQISFLIVRRLLDLVRLGPTPDEKDIEIAVLRHQLAVLDARWRGLGTRRRTGCCWPRWPGSSAGSAGRRSSSPRRLCCAGTANSSPGRGRIPGHGRAANALDDDVVALVLRLAADNSRWGYLRIVGECRKLGVAISATSVRNLLRRHRLRPAPRTSGPSWSEFLRAQAAGALACDFFPVGNRYASPALCAFLYRH